MVDIFTPYERSLLMSRIGQKNTTPEMRVRRTAHAVGLRYALHRKDLAGTPDVVFVKQRLALYVHGCFWHRHDGCSRAGVPKTNCKFWRGKFERNVARDMRSRAELEASGWRTAVIWECETRRIDQLEKIICERVLERAPLPKDLIFRNLAGR